MKIKNGEGELVSYRAASHHYEILETYEAGIVLKGTEVKSLREGGGNLLDNYVTIKGGEAWLRNASIAPYKFGITFGHEEKRERKLLLNKIEILKLKKMTEIKGLTLIALSLYLKKGKVKVKIGVCKGKKAHDKRESEKKKDQMKEIRDLG